MKAIYYLVLMCTVLIACNKEDPDPLLDGNPRIISISFPGIPNENITIDQKNFKITIKLPALLLDDISPSVVLTENAQIVTNLWWHYAIFEDEKLVALGNKNDDLKTPRITYEIVLTTDSEMNFGGIGDSIDYAVHYGRNSWLMLPVRNLYGTKLPLKVVATNQVTGIDYTFDNLQSPIVKKVFNRGWAEMVNQLGIVVYPVNKILPGNYDFEFTFENGRMVKYPATVEVKRDQYELGSWPMVAGAVFKPGEFMNITGYNLFDKSIKVELIDSADHVMQIPDIQFSLDADSLRFGVPMNIAFGRYAVRLTQDGYESNPFCFRIKVDNKFHTPLEILMLMESQGYCSINRKTILTRGEWLPMQANYFEGKARFRLVPVSDESKQFYAKAIIFSYLHFEGEPSIFIPEDVPAGFYKVTLQSLNATGKVTGEGPPFWRVVEVR